MEFYLVPLIIRQRKRQYRFLIQSQTTQKINLSLPKLLKVKKECSVAFRQSEKAYGCSFPTFIDFVFSTVMSTSQHHYKYNHLHKCPSQPRSSIYNQKIIDFQLSTVVALNTCTYECLPRQKNIYINKNTYFVFVLYAILGIFFLCSSNFSVLLIFLIQLVLRMY